MTEKQFIIPGDINSNPEIRDRIAVDMFPSVRVACDLCESGIEGKQKNKDCKKCLGNGHVLHVYPATDWGHAKGSIKHPYWVWTHLNYGRDTAEHNLHQWIMKNTHDLIDEDQIKNLENQLHQKQEMLSLLKKEFRSAARNEVARRMVRTVELDISSLNKDIALLKLSTARNHKS